MKQTLPSLALAVLVSFLMAAPVSGQSGALVSLLAARSERILEVRAANLRDPNIPQEMQALMQRAQVQYIQGSDLLKSGDTDRARESFDTAVDLLLQSRWSIAGTPELNSFLHDLVNRIKRDESLYLRPPQSEEEETESAVADELKALDLIPIQVDPALQDAVEADILTSRYDIPVVLNESVLKSLNYWLGRGRKYFSDGLLRSGRYRDMVAQIFQTEELPLDLMYLAQVESLFKTNALSRAYARGMWQFTRGTALRYGLKVNRYIDERMDPEKSTRAAARYLKDLYGMFEDWNLVLAAYNVGEAKVQKLLDQYGRRDFWELSNLRVRRGLPKETKNHVPLILSSVILAHNPDKYGLPVDLDPPLQYEEVKIPKRVSLNAIAKTLGTEVEALKRLNPALRTSYTPANDPEFELRVPPGIDRALHEELASLPAAKAPPASPDGMHRVRPGDSLWSIAREYGTTVAALQEINDIPSPRTLRVGSLLEIPARGAAKAKSPVRPKPATTEVAKAQQKR
jgi:membrane-bound lytic murein transglycosylase D